MYTATQDNDIHFNQLHKEDNSRIQHKKTYTHCGKEVIVAETESVGKVIDLMEALKASFEKAKKREGTSVSY